MDIEYLSSEDLGVDADVLKATLEADNDSKETAESPIELFACHFYLLRADN